MIDNYNYGWFTAPIIQHSIFCMIAAATTQNAPDERSDGDLMVIKTT